MDGLRIEQIHNHIKELRYFLMSAVYCLIFVVLVAIPNAKAEELLLGIDDSRMRLTSGIFRVTGSTVEKVGDKINKDITEDCFVAFDYEKGCIRFDRGNYSAYLLTPESAYELWPKISENDPTSVTQYEIDHKPAVRINPFDVRNLGFFTCQGSFYRSKYDGFRNFLLNQSKVIDKREKDSLTEITISHKNANEENKDGYATYRIWLDKDNGYTTTRIEANSFQVSEISWENMDDVFVPVSFRQQYKSASSGLTVNADWTLTWEMVNGTVPAELFTYESLRRKEDKYGVLYSSNVDKSNRPIALDYFSESEEPSNGKANSTNITMILLLNGVLLILLGVGRIVQLKMRKRRKGSS